MGEKFGDFRVVIMLGRKGRVGGKEWEEGVKRGKGGAEWGGGTGLLLGLLPTQE